MVAEGGENESFDSFDTLIRKMRQAAACLQYSPQMRQSKFIIRTEEMNKQFRGFTVFNLSSSLY